MTEPLYTFSSPAVPESAHVVGFRGTDALSELYRFEIGLVLRDDEELDLEAVVGYRAALAFHTPAGPQTYRGMIARAELLHAWDGRALYRVLLVPKVWFLTTSRHSWVWVDTDTPSILRAVLGQNNELTAEDFELRLGRRYAARDFVCQYKESDFAFLSRWMEREGIYYYFEHGEEREKLVLTDDKGVHGLSRPEPVRYVPGSAGDRMAHEAFDGFTVTERAIPSSVVENDFDYLKPVLIIREEAASAPRGGGVVFRHGDNAQSPEEAVALARVRAEELGARQRVFVGNGRAFQLRAGFRFALDGHPRAALNGEYLAVRVEHEGIEAAGSPEVRRLLGLELEGEYRVSVTAIAAEVQFRPERKTPTPRIYGVERAFVDGEAESDYAQLDEHGRYRVLLHFDESMREAGAASAWVRMLQPHGGNPEGFHLPLRKATEVMVLFVGGDPDRPVISGAVPNLMSPSPVTRDNHTQNVIQTGGRNRIEMEDQEGEQHLDLSTPPMDTFLHLGEPHDGHGHYVVLHTEGDGLIDIKKNRTTQIGIDDNVDVKGNRTVKVTGHQKTETGAYFSLLAGTDIFANAGASITAVAAQDITERAGKYITESAGINVQLSAGTAVQANAPLVSLGGSALISESAPLIVLKASAGVVVSAPLVTVVGSGAVSISGGTVSVSGSDVKVNGATVSVSGGPVSITGATVTVTGGVINLNS
ncbi:MAG: type VI secretion system tip protein VgrG [Myxococcales bacterium]|nr:type VI secretion system tip protein VgrG [Myxococcales bacterium]